MATRFDVKTIVKDKRFWVASFLIVWAAGLQVNFCISNEFVDSRVSYMEILEFINLDFEHIFL